MVSGAAGSSRRWRRGPRGYGALQGQGEDSDLRSEDRQTQDTGVFRLAGPPGHLARAGRRQGLGRRGPLGFIQVAFRFCPMRGRAHGPQSSSHGAPAGAPLAGSDITSMSTPRSRQLPAGLYGAGPGRPGPPPAPPDTHTGPLFWGLGAQAPQGSTGLPVPPSTPQALALPTRERGGCGLTSTFSSLCPDTPLRQASGPAWHSGLQWVPSNTGQAPTDLREARGASLSRTPALMDAQPWTGAPTQRGGGERQRGDSPCQ